MLVHHYTTRLPHHLASIFNDGVLKLELDQGNPLPCMLWFSRRPDYEPTARKFELTGDDGRRVNAPLSTYLPLAARFTLDTHAVPLLGWKAYQEYCRSLPSLGGAREADALTSALAKLGQSWGASKYDWFCTPTPLPLASLTGGVQVWQDGRWVAGGPGSVIVDRDVERLN